MLHSTTLYYNFNIKKIWYLTYFLNALFWNVVDFCIYVYHKTPLTDGITMFFNFYYITTTKRTPNFPVGLYCNYKLFRTLYLTYLLNGLLLYLVDFVYVYHKTPLDRGNTFFSNFYIVTTIKRRGHTISLYYNFNILKIVYITCFLNFLLWNLVDFCICIPQNPPWPRAYHFFQLLYCHHH